MENMENTNPEIEPTNDAEFNQYWRSLDEKYKTPEFMKTLENEFMSSPLKEEDGKDGLARRQFMKLMGASVALSATACVRRPVEKIIPYNKRPSEIIPDVPNYYASTWFDGTEGLGMVVKTREGRPIHVAGSPEHPLNGQGLSARASASVLSLYDPDRLTGPYINSVNKKKRRNSISVLRKFEQIDPKVAEQLKKGSVAILTSSNPSPHTQDLTEAFLGKFGGKKYVWDVMTMEAVRMGQELSYGTNLVPNYRFDKAKLVVSLDADFLGTYLAPVQFTKDFQKSRDPQGDMSRLISFQSVASLTSLNSDDNYPVKASQQLNVALGLLQRVLAKKGGSLPAKARTPVTDDSVGLVSGTLDAVAKNLLDRAGEGIVIAGGLAAETKAGVALQVAVNWLNTALGNEGKTITAQGARLGLEGKASDITSLIADINSKKIKTLIVHNLNPMYSLPASLKFEETLNNLEMLISTSGWMDETAKLADIVACCGHPMENWNEYEYVSGVRTIQQPTIRPMYETRSFEDSLMAWSKAAGKAIATEETFAEYLKNKTVKALGSEKAWFEYLQTGFRGTPSSGGSARSWSSGAVSMIETVLGNLIGEASASQEKPATELVLYPTSHMSDGSMANVSWLQELPEPVTKISWDNALTVCPQDAKSWNVKDGSVMEVKVGETTIKAPAFIQPGQAVGVVGLAIGYGRTAGGEIQKSVGVNAAQLVQVAEGRFPLIYSGIPVEVKKTSDWYELAITQGHNTMEGRQIVAETTHSNFKKGNTGIHRHKIFSIWSEHKYDGHKWGMAIDLNSCTGCSACVIACQSENNIPVVGRKYIIQGREMHWLRIDRYYKGSESNPDAVFQPVMCQHCENAPCETVCPVVATVHSDEGLNDMIYNRCVGTRYCSNNCPYKVRRFNWFKFDSHSKKAPLHMALNPEVSVRTRGVMEKCSFCVQRIKEAKNTAQDEGRPLKDGEIKTACQEVCPPGGIAFGDLNDKNSEVSKLFENQRQYALLEETNSAPRVRYLAKIRNTDRVDESAHGHDSHHEAPADEKHPAKDHGNEHGAKEVSAENGGRV